MEYAIAGLLGALWGSFANVLIVRVPQGNDWVREPSHCVRCHSQLHWYENIPVVSWLALRGRCRSCHQPISAQYPLVEVAVAAVFVGIVALFGVTWLAGSMALLAVASVAWLVIDLRVQRLPDAITVPTAISLVGMLAVHSGVSGTWDQMLGLMWGAMVLGGAYFVLWFAYPAGLGFGDVKVAAVFGAAAGYLGWSTVGVAGIAGPLLGGIVVAVGLVMGRLTRKSRIPYGPALIVGAWIGLVAGDAVAQWYVSLVVG